MSERPFTVAAGEIMNAPTIKRYGFFVMTLFTYVFNFNFVSSDLLCLGNK